MQIAAQIYDFVITSRFGPYKRMHFTGLNDFCVEHSTAVVQNISKLGMRAEFSQHVEKELIVEMGYLTCAGCGWFHLEDDCGRHVHENGYSTVLPDDSDDECDMPIEYITRPIPKLMLGALVDE
jgi:hypothetical protein